MHACSEIDAAKMSKLHLVSDINNNTLEATRARAALLRMLFTYMAGLMSLLVVRKKILKMTNGHNCL
jgi:hypothetical protein